MSARVRVCVVCVCVVVCMYTMCLCVCMYTMCLEAAYPRSRTGLIAPEEMFLRQKQIICKKEALISTTAEDKKKKKNLISIMNKIPQSKIERGGPP